MYIAIDAGGTSTRVAASPELANPTHLAEPLRRRNTHDFDNDIGFMIESALTLADDQQIEAVGIGTPGSPNKDFTEIASARNLEAWVNKPLLKTLSERLDCPVFYENDGVVAAWGEAYYGSTTGSYDYLIWGTGIGGSRVKHGYNKPHVEKIDWDENFKDWEADCGGNALAAAFGKSPEELNQEEWEAVTRKFEQGLTGYINKNNPSAIVFGGGLALKHADVLLNSSKKLGLSIKVTKFGADSGLMGGFGFIRSKLNS
jgi:predicted NBD/HSP70 family sugar kinase